MCAAKEVGPRLTDLAFFTHAIDATRPGLEAIPSALANNDVPTARAIFAAHIRQNLQPERFLTIPPSFPANLFHRPNESAAEIAERVLRLELISCGTPHQFSGDVDWTINPTFNGYEEWTWQLSRHLEWPVLAQRYRETGDERFAEGFVRLFQSWVRQAVVPENAPGNATLCWRTIEAGIRMAGPWQWALHSFYRSPHFTDDVLVDWYKSVWEHGWRLRTFHRTHNWLIMEMNGLAQIGILYPQFRESAAWKTYAFDHLTAELSQQIYPDGFQYELTTAYSQVVVDNYEWLRDLCLAYDVATPAAWDPILERMHAVNLYLMMPDGRQPDLNDGDWAKAAPRLERALHRYPNRTDFRWAATAGRDGAPPTKTSLAYPYAGYVVMRTGWEPDAVWALFDAGPFGFAHQHEDKLNLLIHAYGHLLLTEGGNYAYDDSEMRRYVLSTRAHNTIRVDGHDQNRRRHFRHSAVDLTVPAPLRWQTTAQYDTAEALYDEGYGPDADSTVTHRRRVIFLKQPPPDLTPFFLVIDRLLPSDTSPHTYELLWHLTAETGLAIVAAAIPDLTHDTVSGQESPEWQGWRALDHDVQGHYESTPTAIQRWSRAGPTRLVTLLYPVPPDAQCPIQTIAAAEDITDTRLTLTLSNGTQIDLEERDFDA